MKDSPERCIMLQNLGRIIAILIFRDIKKEPNLFQWGKPLNAEILKIKKLLNTLKKLSKGMYIGGIIQGRWYKPVLSYQIFF